MILAKSICDPLSQQWLISSFAFPDSLFSRPMERDLQAWLSGPVHAWRCAGTDFIVATRARFACSVVFLHRICSVHEKGREGIKKESLALCLPVQKVKILPLRRRMVPSLHVFRASSPTCLALREAGDAVLLSCGNFALIITPESLSPN
jgi:hypothetical protein